MFGGASTLRKTVTWLAIGLLLTGCAAGTLDLPPVGASGGGRTPGAIIWHDLISDTPEQTRRFYGELFAWEFEPVAGVNYQLIRQQGKVIGGMVDQTRLANPVDISQWVVAMSVADIEAAAGRVGVAGGTVFTPPTSLGARGRIAVVADNSGAVLSLLQTADGDPAETAGDRNTGDFLWNELWVPDPATAARFYMNVVPVRVEPLALEFNGAPLDFHLLRSGGAARAGIRPMPVADLSPRWVSYLRVADEQELHELLARVESLGGEVLMPATRRPAGGSVAVIAGPSGAGIALQTWPVPERRDDGEGGL